MEAIAATPEESLRVRWPEPVLVDHAASASAFDDDMVLPYISRLLMEDDVQDHFFYQYPDHPALLHAQQPFAQILASSSDEAATAKTATFPTAAVHRVDQYGLFDAAGDKQGSLDMVNMAFLKGMEEANKFLPTNSLLLLGLPLQDGHGMLGGGRNSKKVNCSCRDDGLELEDDRATKLKLMAPELEEEGAREMLDEMMVQEDEICMKGVKQLSLSENNKSSSKVGRKKARGRRTVIHTEPVDLHNLLLHCAQARAAEADQAALLAVGRRRTEAGTLLRAGVGGPARRHGEPGVPVAHVAAHLRGGLPQGVSAVHGSLLLQEGGVGSVLSTHHTRNSREIGRKHITHTQEGKTTKSKNTQGVHGTAHRHQHRHSLIFTNHQH